MTFTEIQSAIADLSQKDFDRLLRWMKEESWRAWDLEIEEDDRAGRLDSLRDESLREKENGTLRDL